MGVQIGHVQESTNRHARGEQTGELDLMAGAVGNGRTLLHRNCRLLDYANHIGSHARSPS